MEKFTVIARRQSRRSDPALSSWHWIAALTLAMTEQEDAVGFGPLPLI
jgi:hypothetical protein